MAMTLDEFAKSFNQGDFYKNPKRCSVCGTEIKTLMSADGSEDYGFFVHRPDPENCFGETSQIDRTIA